MNGDQHDQLITICIFDSTSVTIGISQAKPNKNVKMLLKKNLFFVYQRPLLFTLLLLPMLQDVFRLHFLSFVLFSKCSRLYCGTLGMQ